MDVQFKTSRGILIEVYFGSFRMHFPCSAWKDSSLERRVEFSSHESEPYMRTGRAQHSTILREERIEEALLTMREESCTGLANPFISEHLLKGAESHHTPIHFTECSTGRCVLPMVMLSDGAHLFVGWKYSTLLWTEVEAPGFSKGMNSEDLLSSISEIRGSGSDVVCISKSPKK